MSASERLIHYSHLRPIPLYFLEGLSDYNRVSLRSPILQTDVMSIDRMIRPQSHNTAIRKQDYFSP